MTNIKDVTPTPFQRESGEWFYIYNGRFVGPFHNEQEAQTAIEEDMQRSSQLNFWED